MAKQRIGRPVHYQHYKTGQYAHTYCGLINFAGYYPWNFTRVKKGVSCKRCEAAIGKDDRMVSFKAKCEYWAVRRAKARK